MADSDVLIVFSPKKNDLEPGESKEQSQTPPESE